MLKSFGRLGILVLVLLSWAAGARAAERVTVVLRYDDYSALSQTAFEIVLLAACERLGLPLVLGVVPHMVDGDGRDPAPRPYVPLTPHKIDLLRSGVEKGSIEVALHGYRHHMYREGNDFSEFDGRPYFEQREMIAAGRQLIEEAWGVTPETFIPPWNTYDANTVRAAADLGFRCFSADREGPVGRGIDIKYLPATAALRELKAAVVAARKSREKSPVVVVLLHSYDVVEINRERGVVMVHNLIEGLEWLAAQTDVDVLTISGVVAGSAELGEERHERFSEFSSSVLSGIIPRQLEHLYFPPYLLSPAECRQGIIKGWLLALLFYASLFALAIRMGYAVSITYFTRPYLLRKAAQLSAVTAPAVLGIIVTRDMEVYMRGWVLLALSTGLGMGVLLAMARTHRRRQLHGVDPITASATHAIDDRRPQRQKDLVDSI